MPRVKCTGKSGLRWPKSPSGVSLPVYEPIAWRPLFVDGRVLILWSFEENLHFFVRHRNFQDESTWTAAEHREVGNGLEEQEVILIICKLAQQVTWTKASMTFAECEVFWPCDFASGWPRQFDLVPKNTIFSSFGYKSSKWLQQKIQTGE